MAGDYVMVKIFDMAVVTRYRLTAVELWFKSRQE